MDNQEPKSLADSVESAWSSLGNFPDDMPENLGEPAPSQESAGKVEAPAAKPAETKPEAKPEAPKVEQKADESHLPEDLRTPTDMTGEEQLKRIKGFQASYTRKMQAVEQELRAEYDKKFQEILARMPAQQAIQSPQEQPKNSLADFFPGAPKEQLEPLDKAIKTIVENQISSLKQENQTLKQYMNQSAGQAKLQQQFLEAKQLHPEIDTRVQDIVAWGHLNPEVARGKSVTEMYRLMTYEEQFKRGRDTALAELRKKEKESLETDSVPNTVSSPTVKSIYDAARLAEQTLQAKYRK